jgi:hypothetical protein
MPQVYANKNLLFESLTCKKLSSNFKSLRRAGTRRPEAVHMMSQPETLPFLLRDVHSSFLFSLYGEPGDGQTVAT